jgi:cytochrome c553
VIEKRPVPASVPPASALVTRMLLPRPVIAIMLILLPVAARAADGDVAAGRRKALQCQTCHGLDGLSRLPEAPHLAGQPAIYLEKSLNDFRQGVRKNEMMDVIVKQLTDQDVADLAAYFSAIEVTTKPPG